MTSLYEEAAAKAREEVFRLLKVYLDIIPADKLAEIRKDHPDMKPRAQMVIEWEPLSYRKEGGKRGNVELDFFPLSYGLEDDEVEHVRQAFWRGIPESRRMTIPKSVSQARQPWQRLMLAAKEAGLRIEIGEDGNFQSPDVGQVFRVEAGFVSFPTFVPNPNGKGGKWTNPDKGEEGRDIYMRYPMANITDSYVQPDDVPVRIVNSSDDDEPQGTAVTSTASTSGGLSAAQIAAAFAEAGIAGMPVADFQTAAQQMKVTNEAGSRAPILFTSEIQSKASEGQLLNFAVEKGAVTVVDDVIQVAA